jgi:hypothetical protein
LHFFNSATITVIPAHQQDADFQGNTWSLLMYCNFNYIMLWVTYMESTSFYWTDGWQRSVGWFWKNFHWSCSWIHIHTHKFILVEWGWELRTKLTNPYAMLTNHNSPTATILKPVRSWRTFHIIWHDTTWKNILVWF